MLMYDCLLYSGLPDPSTEAFFGLLSSIIGEMAELFPDAYFHMGGDEIKLDCWSTDSKARDLSSAVS